MKKQLVSLVSHFLLALLFTCGLAAAEDSPRLQKLKHTVLSPTSEQVILQLNGSYSPKVFTLKDENPRIIFDFADMTHGKEVKPVMTTNGAIVKRIRVGVHTDAFPKTRIVFDVATMKGVTFTQNFDEQSSSLIIQFTGPKKAAETTPPKVTSTEPAPQPLVPAAAGTEAAATPTPAAPPSPAAPSKEPVDKTVAAPPAAPAESTAAPGKAASAPAPQAPVAPAESLAVKKPDAQAPAEKSAAPSDKPAEKAVTESKDAEKTPALPPPTETKPKPSPAPPAPTAEKAEQRPAVAPETKPAEKPAVEAAASPAPDGKKEEKSVAPAAKETPSPEPAAKTETAGKAAAEAKPEAKPEAADTAKTESAPSADKGKTDAAKLALQPPASEGPQLEYVKFDSSSPKGEMVLFKLNGFHPPAVHGAEEGIPRVICDFNNTKLIDTTKSLIKTNGKFVKSIRTTKTKRPEKVRVVIDLEPNRSYDLQQVFFKEDNLFVLIINTVKK